MIRDSVSLQGSHIGQEIGFQVVAKQPGGAAESQRYSHVTANDGAEQLKIGLEPVL